MLFALALVLTSGQTLVDYLNRRTDLTTSEKAEWERALRLTFGGSALRAEADDEALGAARSVIAYGMFNRLDPMKVMRAAYEAKNDALSFVPPPMAIKYQQLALMGRKPKETARFLAFNFPRYFDEELAPEMVSYWQMLLDSGKANGQDVPRIQRQLEETRTKMKPQLRELCKRAAEMERDVSLGVVTHAQVDDALNLARHDLVLALGRDRGHTPFLTLFEALSRELKLPATLAPPKAPAPSLDVPSTKKKAPVPEEPAGAPPERPQRQPAPRKAEEPSDAREEAREEASQRSWERLPVAVKRWLGTPYLWGGVDEKGIDCSGFSREVYRDTQQLELPRTSGQQYLEGLSVPREELQEGDLVFFDTLERGRITHVGVYKGNGLIAHATSSRGVVEEKLDAKWLLRAYRGARRIL